MQLQAKGPQGLAAAAKKERPLQLPREQGPVRSSSLGLPPSELCHCISVTWLWCLFRNHGQSYSRAVRLLSPPSSAPRPSRQRLTATQRNGCPGETWPGARPPVSLSPSDSGRSERPVVRKQCGASAVCKRARASQKHCAQPTCREPAAGQGHGCPLLVFPPAKLCLHGFHHGLLSQAHNFLNSH